MPLSITYETKGTTPLPVVIIALQATDALSRDAVSLLPSLIPGLEIQASSANVRVLTQESPLREYFLLTLIIAFQDDLRTEVPPVLEELFNVSINDDYDSLVTVAFMVVLFYGVNFAKDAALRIVSDGKTRLIYRQLLREVSQQTNRSEEEIEKILESRFAKPTAIRKLVAAASNFFLPSHRESSVPVVVDRHKIDSDAIREVPFGDVSDKSESFERFQPFKEVTLELHAKDKDKKNAGWAAVAQGVCDERVRLKIMDPVTVEQIWGKDVVVGDIVLVSKMTAQGFAPSEIHLLAIAV